jgi:tryptophan-rich sensory protein
MSTPAYFTELFLLNVGATLLISSIGITLARLLGSADLGEEFKKLKPNFLSRYPWVFGLVWFVLYILMGTAAYFVRKEGGACWSSLDNCVINNVRAMILYWSLQVVLSLYVFTVMGRQTWFALGTLVVLASLVLCIIVDYNFFLISLTAGILMIFPCVWLVIALGLSIWTWAVNGERQVRSISRNQSGAKTLREERKQRLSNF